MTDLPLKRSRVLVFENLVDIEEVDEDLREEVKIECDRYGEVQLCLIHTVPSESLVRIFAQYKLPREADEAYIDFQKRQFAGKAIVVDYYAEDNLEARKFNNPSLNPQQ